MVAAGHRPDNYLLARFTDGRAKAVLLSEDMLADDRLATLRSEHGPVASALHVSIVSGPGSILLRVEDLTSPDGPRLEQRGERINGLLKCDEPVWAARDAGCYSRDLRNSAIFAESLGMTTGWLPKVDSSLSPAGVSS